MLQKKKKAPAALGQALKNEVTQIGTIRVNSCFVSRTKFRVDSCRVSLDEQKSDRVVSDRRVGTSCRAVLYPIRINSCRAKSFQNGWEIRVSNTAEHSCKVATHQCLPSQARTYILQGPAFGTFIPFLTGDRSRPTPVRVAIKSNHDILPGLYH